MRSKMWNLPAWKSIAAMKESLWNGAQRRLARVYCQDLQLELPWGGRGESSHSQGTAGDFKDSMKEHAMRTISFTCQRTALTWNMQHPKLWDFVASQAKAMSAPHLNNALYIVVINQSSLRHFGRVVKATACYPSRTMCDSRCVRTRRFESCRCR